MRVSVLGELEVRLGGHAVDLGGPKPRALTGLLVAGGGRPVPVDHLVDQIWGDDPPARVEVSLQTYVARLRRTWEAAAGPEARRRIRTHAGAYSLDLGGAEVDAQRFVGLVRSGRLEDAVGLWRGPAYAGLDCPALRAEATRLGELRTEALERLWDQRLLRGEHREAVGELERLTRTEPLHEPWWALLARALYAAGRQGDALAALRRARQHLADELGVDPGPELRRVEAAVLRQDPELSARPSPPDPSPPPALPAPPHGRAAPLAAAAEALAVAGEGRGGVLVVAGEPGIGKTWLLDRIAALAAQRGLRVGRGGWEDEGAPPLWGWRRACAELLGDAAVLDAAGTDAATASFWQAEALGAAVRGTGPSLLVLDDVHWADADSLRLLRRVAAECARLPLVVLVGVRSAEAEQHPAVADALVALTRAGAQRWDLTGLSAEDVRSWVGATTGAEVTQETATRLVERTGGNPFYVTELVRLLVAEQALTDPSAAAWDAVPAGVRDVVRSRIAGLGPALTPVVGAAAVTGRTFDHQVVARAAGVGLGAVEEGVEALRVLGLVADVGPDRSSFAHALVRDAVHDTLAPAVRARTHAAVAVALEQHHAGEVAAHAAELAEHWRLAGAVHARSAWLFAATAAEHAAAQSAHDEALRLWSSAEESHHRDAEGTAAQRERLLLGRARALIGLGRTIEAWSPVAEAGASALAEGRAVDAAEALLSVTRDLVWGWRHHPTYDDEAIALWTAVRDAVVAERGDDVLVARLTAALAVECFFKPGLEEECTALAEAAVRQVRVGSAAPEDRLEVVQLAMTALNRPELLDREVALCDELVGLATRVGRPSRVAAALVNRAALRGELGQLEQARSDVVRAADLAARHHLPQNLMVTGWARAHLLQVEARWDDAESLLDELEAFEATLAVSGRGIALAQRAVIRDWQGRLPELLGPLEHAAPHHPMLRELYALALVRGGDLAAARRWIGPWSEQPPLPRDYLWVTTTVVRSWVWTALADPAAVTALRTQLAPFADRLAYGTQTIVFCGAVAHWLGELAVAAGDVPAARAHLEDAVATHRRLDLPFWRDLGERRLRELDG